MSEGSAAFVRGAVVDASSDPVPDASVTPIGRLLFDCSMDAGLFLPIATTADSLGRFVLLVQAVEAPGLHCVSFKVSSTAAAATDTVRDVQLEFRFDYMPPDTTDVTPEVSW